MKNHPMKPAPLLLWSTAGVVCFLLLSLVRVLYFFARAIPTGDFWQSFSQTLVTDLVVSVIAATVVILRNLRGRTNLR